MGKYGVEKKGGNGKIEEEIFEVGIEVGGTESGAYKGGTIQI